MCTAFIHRGNDVLFGFNMDINVGASGMISIPTTTALHRLPCRAEQSLCPTRASTP